MKDKLHSSEISMTSIVLAFAGGIASGKSTLSQAVANAMGWPRVNFGEYVRKEAAARRLSPDRESLQTLGQELIQGNLEDFCREVLSQEKWKPGLSLVIDGVRHIDVVGKLRELVSPTEFRLVFVLVDHTTRSARLSKDRGTATNQLSTWEAHSTEADIGSVLPSVADIVVDGNKSLDELVSQVTSWIRLLPGLE